jgi:class 3 adenylate cyclase
MSDSELNRPVKAERRLAAILAGDIVGYSQRMERDEVGTLQRLRDLRSNLIEPKVAEHRGRVFKTMGDGFLAEFVSALDAVHCAVDIQRAMAARAPDLHEDGRLQLRIGINLGDVFHEGEDVFGDGVNVAARLQGIAPPGGICISRAASDPIRERSAFAFEDLGEHQVKNITRPIHVFGVRIEGAAKDGSVGKSELAHQPRNGATITVVGRSRWQLRIVNRWGIAAASTMAILVLGWYGLSNFIAIPPISSTTIVPAESQLPPGFNKKSCGSDQSSMHATGSSYKEYADVKTKKGLDARADYAVAVYCMRMSAQAGSSLAAAWLAAAYKFGEDYLPQDEKLSRQWACKALQLGYNSDDYTPPMGLPQIGLRTICHGT